LALVLGSEPIAGALAGGVACAGVSLGPLAGVAEGMGAEGWVCAGAAMGVATTACAALLTGLGAASV